MAINKKFEDQLDEYRIQLFYQLDETRHPPKRLEYMEKLDLYLEQAKDYEPLRMELLDDVIRYAEIDPDFRSEYSRMLDFLCENALIHRREEF